MILGRFVGGRPFVQGRVVIPVAAPDEHRRAATADVIFLVDTGADTTLLSPVDYEDALHLMLPNAPPGPPSEGVGGTVQTRRVSGYLFLEHDDGAWSGFPVAFSIPASPPGQRPLPFSLLGRDILAFGTLTMDIPRERLTLDLPTLLPRSATS